VLGVCGSFLEAFVENLKALNFQRGGRGVSEAPRNPLLYTPRQPVSKR